MDFRFGAARRTPAKFSPNRLSGPAVQMLIVIDALLCAAAGLSLALVAVLLSATAVSLVLIVLRGERQRDVALESAIDRLVREARVTAASQASD